LARSAAPDLAVAHRRGRHRAFSLAEALTASVVLAIAVIGVAGPLTAASLQAEQARETATATVLARQLMEEIVSKPLLDNANTTYTLGPEAGETSRALYDSANDYNGYTDSSATLKAVDGTRVAVPAGYTRSVSVEYRTTTAGAAAASGDFGVVTVTVRTPGAQTVKLVRMLTRSRVTSTS
jgi:Tfp pilus assembly protein PilV